MGVNRLAVFSRWFACHRNFGYSIPIPTVWNEMNLLGAGLENQMGAWCGLYTHLLFVFCFRKTKFEWKTMAHGSYSIVVVRWMLQVLSTGVVGRLSCREATRGASLWLHPIVPNTTHTQNTTQKERRRRKRRDFLSDFFVSSVIETLPFVVASCHRLGWRQFRDFFHDATNIAEAREHPAPFKGIMSHSLLQGEERKLKMSTVKYGTDGSRLYHSFSLSKL